MNYPICGLNCCVDKFYKFVGYFEIWIDEVIHKKIVLIILISLSIENENEIAEKKYKK